MNNKEFNALVASKAKMTQKTAQQILSAAVDLITEQMSEVQQVSLFQVGTLEVKEQAQRVIVNPTTKHKMLVPPKLVPQFKAAPSMKNKIKEL